MTIKTLPQWRNFAIGSREEVRQSQVSHDRVRYDLSKSCYANSRFQIENGERRYQREREKEREKIDEILFPFSVNLMNIFQILVRLVISLSLSLSPLGSCFLPVIYAPAFPSSQCGYRSGMDTKILERKLTKQDQKTGTF